ncbi:MAG: hypothetical protein ABIQ07_08635 [Ginsengibacter sp.]
MKKILIVLLVLSCVAFIGIYVFIPGKINFREVILIKANQINANRFITDESKWNKWWPKATIRNEQANIIQTDTNYFYKNYYYAVILKMIQGDSIIINNNSIRINSLLNIIPINSDSVAIQWKGQSASISDPVKRFKNYLDSKKIEKGIEDILQSMKIFLENKDSLYGIHIDQIQVKDTLLVATKYSSITYPTTTEIYTLIKSLKDFISKQEAIETNYPMLNIMQDSGRFSTMVAIPVNKLIPTKNNFLSKRMVPGKILITEVRGGDYTANQALKQIELYMNDYHLTPPAIPFQSLVTDRSKEPDTTKWITKIFYPVM